MKPSDDAIIAQQFTDALRECLGLAPLYSDPRTTEVERFYVRHVEHIEGAPRSRIEPGRPR